MEPFVFDFSLQTIIISLIIFVVRVVGIALDTLRIMVSIRQKNGLAMLLGFIETVIFVLSIGIVLDDLSNVLKVFAYSAGFAVGNVVGMWAEKKLALGYAHINIITKQGPDVVAKALREKDYAVTEIPASGKDGSVWMCDLTVRRKDTNRVEQIAREADPQAFITVEEITPIRRGYWGARQIR